MPLLALDLGRVPRGSAVAEWMAEKPPQRSIGAVFFPGEESEFALPGDPSANWNVLLFVENTTAAQQNYAHKQLPPAVVGEGVNSEPANLDFAAAGAIPDHWQLVNQTLDPVHRFDCGRLRRSRAGRLCGLCAELGSWPWGDLRLSQSFPAAPWRGRRIAFKAAIRAQAQAMGAGKRCPYCRGESVLQSPTVGRGQQASAAGISAARASAVVRLDGPVHRGRHSGGCRKNRDQPGADGKRQRVVRRSRHCKHRGDAYRECGIGITELARRTIKCQATHAGYARSGTGAYEALKRDEFKSRQLPQGRSAPSPLKRGGLGRGSIAC